MTRTVTAATGGLSRRGFIAGTAGLTFTLSIGGALTPRSAAALAAAGGEAHAIGAWVRIAPSGAITIAAPAAEMGQGVMTALPMILAEEMDADWEQVSAFFPEARPEHYGNPGFGGLMHVVWSHTVTGYWTKVRQQGAAVRRFLMEAAAEEWGVPVEELSTEPSAVVHAASGRRLGYGEIAGFATAPETLPEVDEADLKDPADFRIIGTDVARLDLPPKVDGSAKYGSDVVVPGMVYATIARAPVPGAEVASINEDEVAAMDGVLEIVRLPHAVAIVGESVWQVFAAREALAVEWEGGTNAGYDSEPALEAFAERAADLAEEGLVFHTSGDAIAAKANGGRLITGDYLTDYVYHAQMEPMNITASVSEDGRSAEIWVGTQSPSPVLAAAAATLDTEPGNIRIHQHYLGGGFGRRAAVDTIPEALMIAKAVGRPVKVVWTREEDVHAAMMRPQTAHHLEAVIDEAGALAAWHHRIVAEAVTGYAQPARLEQAGGLDPLTLENAAPKYGIPNQLVEYLRHVAGTPLQAWRAIGAGHNNFAIECFIDDIARELEADPVEFRLGLLEDERARAVIEAAAELADWGRQPEAGRAFGVAFCQYKETRTAGVVEVGLDEESGVIRAYNFWNAVDPGIAVHPPTIVTQMESCIVWGLSQALKERMTLVDGRVQQSNYHDYEILRLSETPEIHTRVLSTDNPPSGIGEVSLPLVGPAVSNAVLALTGRRLRHMPFTPDRVRAALA